MVAQRFGLVADAVVALQHGDVADGIAHMVEDLVVVPLDRLLAFAGLAHDQPANGDVERAERDQHHRHAQIERQRGRDQKNQRHESRQVLAHEFEPERRQGVDRAQHRVERVRGASLVVPGERHGDHALEGVAEHPCPARMREAVGAARHQNGGHDVEDAETGPEDERRDQFLVTGNRIDDPAEQDRLGDGHHGKDDVGAADQGYSPPIRAQIPESPPVNLEQ